MRCNCLSGVRVLFNLVSLIASTVAPTFAYSQALTLVQSGTRYAGTITSGFNGDFGAATTVSLNTPSYIYCLRLAGESIHLVNVNNAARSYGTPNPNFTGTVNGVIPGGASFVPGDSNTFDSNSIKRQGQPYANPQIYQSANQADRLCTH